MPDENEKEITPAENPPNPSLEQRLKEPGSQTAELPKKRGRPRKDAGAGAGQPSPEPEPLKDVPKEADPMYTMAIMAGASLFTSRLCPDMPITLEEAERISLPLTQIMAHIAPRLLPIHIACFHLGLSVLGVAVPRVLDVMERRKKQTVTPETPVLPAGDKADQK